MVWHSHLFQNFPQFIVIHTVKGFGTRLFQTLGFEIMGFPGGSDGKESAYSVGDPGLILGLGRSPGEGKGKPLQYSCLENSMDRGACWATVHGVEKSQT